MMAEPGPREAPGSRKVAPGPIYQAVRLIDGPSAAGAGRHPERNRSSSPSVEERLSALLARHPDAGIAAIVADQPDGLVPVPESVPIGPDTRRLSGDVLELVSRPDRAVVARLWWQAQQAGVASGSVRLLQDDPGQATITFFDLRDVHGFLIIVIVMGVSDAQEVGGAPEEAFSGPTRFARMIKDGTARILDVDEAFERMMGYPRADLIGRRIVEFVHPDDHQVAIQQWMQMCELPGPSRPVRLRQRASDGRWIWLEVTNYNRLDHPEHGDVLADMVDISEEVAAHEALRARQQLLEQVTASVPIGLLHADGDGRLLYANDRLTELTGLRAGVPLVDWPGVTSPRHRALLADALSTAVGGSPTDTLVEAAGGAGNIRHYSLNVRPLLDDHGTVTGVTGSVEDVTASVAERRELEVRAATDALTNCLNRSATLSTIQDALAELGSPSGTGGPPSSAGVGVIFLDVDNLKEVNDELGHSAGDALLVEVATRLRAAVRSRDTVGRFGGDEFVLVTRHVPGPDRALAVAQSVASRVMSSFAVDGRSVDIRASFGVAWTGTAGVLAPWLVQKADEAMYRSKRDGRCEPVLAG